MALPEKAKILYCDRLGDKKEKETYLKMVEKMRGPSNHEEMDFDYSLALITQEYTSFFETDMITSKDNLKIKILETKSLSLKQRNTIVNLHNAAVDDSIYGERLYSYLTTLKEQGVVDQEWVEMCFIYSVDWPKGIKMQLL